MDEAQKGLIFGLETQTQTNINTDTNTNTSLMPYSAGPDHGWVRQQRVWGWVLTEDIVLKIVLVSRYWSWHHQSPWKMSQPQGGRTAKDTQQIHTIWQEAILMTRLLGKGHTAERKCCKNLAVCMCEWEGRCVRRGEGGGGIGGLGVGRP